MVNYNSALWNRLWTQRDIFKAEAEHEYFGHFLSSQVHAVARQ